MARVQILGNGMMAVGIDACGRLSDLYYPYVGRENHLLAHPAHLGIRIHDRTLWVDDTWKAHWYRAAHGECSLEIRPRGGEIALRIHDAIDPARPLLVRSIDVVKKDPLLGAVTLYFHHDLFLLESDIGNCVRYDLASGAVVHYKRDRWLLVNAAIDGRIGADDWTVARRDDHAGRGARSEADDGALRRNPVAMGAGESIFAKTIDFAGRDSVQVRLWLAMGESAADVFALDRAVRRDLDGPLRASRDHHDVLASRRPPIAVADLGERVEWVFERSLDLLLAHVGATGSIVAALDGDLLESARDSYAYVWPRDAALIVDALARFGQQGAVRSALLFLADRMTPGGFLEQRYGADGSLGSTWHNVVDTAAPHLPIQEDETALSVWAAARYLELAGVDTALYERLILPGAEFLARYRDPETKLPLPSFDLWEERLGVHIFTVTAVEGALRAASKAAAAARDGDATVRFALAADEVTAGRERYLFHNDAGRYARCGYRIDGGYYLDVVPDFGSIGLFLFAAAHTDPLRLEASMLALENELEVRGLGGFARYRGDPYWRAEDLDDRIPGNPWIITTLWAARRAAAVARSPADLERPRAWIRWCADRAAPTGALAEQFHASTGAPLSVMPLAWSHAEFLQAVADYAAARNRIGERRD